MAGTPKRPIVYRFVIGKGRVKRRQESSDTSRLVVEQVTISFANQKWDEIKTTLRDRIATDVRTELIHVAGHFRKHVIGAPGNQRGLVGTLTTVAKGNQPKTSLGSLPRWAPRGAAYLRSKQKATGHQDWFDNSTWTKARRVGRGAGQLGKPGLLREFFDTDTVTRPGGGDVNIGGGGAWEDVFGEIRVDVIRNNKGFGTNAGVVRVGGGTHMQMQLATVRVRALGKVTERMMQISSQPNYPLFNAFIAAGERDVALHLRGGRGRYRPTLEPYLRFFLERAIPHAVNERLRKGAASGGLLRKA